MPIFILKFLIFRGILQGDASKHPIIIKVPSQKLEVPMYLEGPEKLDQSPTKLEVGAA